MISRFPAFLKENVAKNFIRRRCVAARAMPASCVPQGRGVAPQACRPLAFGKAGGLHPRHAGFLPAARPERAQQSPRRGRVLSSRSSAALAAGAWPHGPCRLLAFRKGGKFPAKLAPRTCISGPIKRERQLAAPRREETAEALRRESPRAGTHPLKKGPFAGSFFAC